MRGLKTNFIQRCCWVMAHFKGLGGQRTLVLRPTEGGNLRQCPHAVFSPLPVFSKGHTCLLGIPPLASTPGYCALPPPWAQGRPHWTWESHFKPGRWAQSQCLPLYGALGLVHCYSAACPAWCTLRDQQSLLSRVICTLWQAFQSAKSFAIR